MKVSATRRAKIALVACCADPSVNPRPFRTIQLLRTLGYRVMTLSYPLSRGTHDVEYSFVHSRRARLSGLIRRLVGYAIAGLTLLRLNRWLPLHVWSIRLGALHHITDLQRIQFSLVVAHDWPLLPICLALKKTGSRVVFDAREYYPREFEASRWFRLAEAPERTRVLRACIPAIDGFTTVSQGLANQYQCDFLRQPSVIYSTPYFADISPTGVTEKIRMVHHGVANRDRSLEVTIDLAKRLAPRFELDLYLTGDKDYINELIRRVGSCHRIRILPPVPFESIAEMLRRYDVGFFFLPPRSFNNEFALPNKFFEYVQARLAVAIGPSPEMSRLASQYKFGIIARTFDPQAMIDALHQVTNEQVVVMKQCAGVAARQLCWEAESLKLAAVLEGQ